MSLGLALGTVILALAGALATASGAKESLEENPPHNQSSAMLDISDIRQRDPFVLPVQEDKTYYLYGTVFSLPDGPGFQVYTSRDLRSWTEPVAAFRPPERFWGTRHYWAPEVHAYRGEYYMFATFYGDNVHRGTQILSASAPAGPFAPHSDGAATPKNWDCLDGTLYVDESDQPWMVFCHQWIHTDDHDGEICAVRLSDDLTTADSEPVLLFHASDVPWTRKAGRGEVKGYITDGPYLHRTRSGTLIMLWSSFGEGGFGGGGYKLAQCYSETGTIEGPWIHQEAPLYGEDGGHAMLFRTFEGRLMAVFHSPDRRGDERVKCLELKEDEPWLAIAEPEEE